MGVLSSAYGFHSELTFFFPDCNKTYFDLMVYEFGRGMYSVCAMDAVKDNARTRRLKEMVPDCDLYIRHAHVCCVLGQWMARVLRQGLGFYMGLCQHVELPSWVGFRWRWRLLSLGDCRVDRNVGDVGPSPSYEHPPHDNEARRFGHWAMYCLCGPCVSDSPPYHSLFPPDSTFVLHYSYRPHSGPIDFRCVESCNALSQKRKSFCRLIS